MQACVLHGVGDLRYEEVANPELRTGEVLLKVGACALCGSDLPRVFTQGTYTFPTIIGHEVAGEIVETGPNVSPDLVGKLATVFPLIPCMECEMCEIGEYPQCVKYNSLGSRCDGAFAEYLRVPEWNLAFVPTGVSIEQAAMTEPAAVSLHALRQAGVNIGETVLILGAGPIGLLLATWADAWGAGKVLLVDIDAERLAFAKRLGFSHVCNSSKEDLAVWVDEVCDGGADVVVEASGSAAALEQCMFMARPMGRVVLMGNPQGDMSLPQQAYGAILRKQLKLSGSWNSSYSHIPRNEWKTTLDFMAAGKLDVTQLITHRISLAELPDIMSRMNDRSVFANKVMYVNPEMLMRGFV